ncbi:Extracellular metalloproteinase NpI [Colletotrichum sp. SAR 10_76]|nr:Extracellular metalloproteinase NpI [Colletotrichum sp. SAR 10_76]
MNPDESARQSVANPEDTATSPFGWHSDGTQEYTTLQGNNAFVTISSGNNPSSPSLLFSYPYSPATTDPASYVEASATQGFYIVNKFHDILYKLGFDEDAGNFQTNNNGKGGASGDPLELIVQASAGSAQIYVPADGRSPRLSMGVWTGTPRRDSMFDATVLLHEYMHGVTGRLVGGPATSGCLSDMNGLSINEGYSDFVPTLLRVKEGDTRSTDYTIADWATGQPIGLRSHYVSTSLETSPLTYSSLNELVSTGGFDLATVWASVLYDVFWNMVEAYGIGDPIMASEIQIRLAKPSDADAIGKVHNEALNQFHEFYQAFYEHPIGQIILGNTRNVVQNPKNQFYVAVDDSDTVVGFIRYHVVDATEPSDATTTGEAYETPAVTTPASNLFAIKDHMKELWERFGHPREDEMDACYEKAVDGRKHNYIKHIMVDPKYQRKGIGAKLLRTVIDISDAERVPTFLVASAEGYGLYKRLGFKDLQTWTIDNGRWAKVIVQHERDLGLTGNETLAERFAGTKEVEKYMMRWETRE